jgi:4-hydroxy-3-methylbut-2-enyl diphosphate reductase
VHHVQTADDLLPNWFNADDTVGITAGTSTPDFVIAEVEKRLSELAATNSPYAKTKAAIRTTAATTRVSMKPAVSHTAQTQFVK